MNVILTKYSSIKIMILNNCEIFVAEETILKLHS